MSLRLLGDGGLAKTSDPGRTLLVPDRGGTGAKNAIKGPKLSKKVKFTSV